MPSVYTLYALTLKSVLFRKLNQRKGLVL